MPTFYRFLRPIAFNYHRSTIEMEPMGGVCFFVQQDEKLKVSYSICPLDQTFNREVAKKLARNAPSSEIESVSVSTASIIHGILAQPGHEELAAHVEKMQTKATNAFQFELTTRDVIRALAIRQRYHDLQS